MSTNKGQETCPWQRRLKCFRLKHTLLWKVFQPLGVFPRETMSLEPNVTSIPNSFI